MKYPPEKQLHILDRLAWSEMFESFLANKYAAAKRFGLEGCETLIPGMKALIDRAADQGVDNVVMGMPHRGRPCIPKNEGKFGGIVGQCCLQSRAGALPYSIWICLTASIPPKSLSRRLLYQNPSIGQS